MNIVYFSLNILGEEQNVEVIKEGEIRETQLQHVRAVLEQQVIKADTEAAAKITDAEGKLRDAKTKADQVTIEGEFLFLILDDIMITFNPTTLILDFCICYFWLFLYLK